MFYRDWTVRTASGLGVTGWVRNLPDGTVEAHLEGEADALEAMVQRMHDGPPRADPTHIDREAAQVEGFADFSRR